jgi:hypothetical protein
MLQKQRKNRYVVFQLRRVSTIRMIFISFHVFKVFLKINKHLISLSTSVPFKFLKDKEAAKKAEQDAIKARQLEHKQKMASISKRAEPSLPIPVDDAPAKKSPEPVKREAPATQLPSTPSKVPAKAVGSKSPSGSPDLAAFIKDQRGKRPPQADTLIAQSPPPPKVPSLVTI